MNGTELFNRIYASICMVIKRSLDHIIYTFQAFSCPRMEYPFTMPFLTALVILHNFLREKQGELMVNLRHCPYNDEPATMCIDVPIVHIDEVRNSPQMNVSGEQRRLAMADALTKVYAAIKQQYNIILQ